MFVYCWCTGCWRRWWQCLLDEADGDIEIKVYFQCDMEEDVVLYVVCGFVVAQDDDDDDD